MLFQLTAQRDMAVLDAIVVGVAPGLLVFNMGVPAVRVTSVTIRKTNVVIVQITVRCVSTNVHTCYLQ